MDVQTTYFEDIVDLNALYKLGTLSEDHRVMLRHLRSAARSAAVLGTETDRIVSDPRHTELAMLEPLRAAGDRAGLRCNALIKELYPPQRPRRLPDHEVERMEDDLEARGLSY